MKRLLLKLALFVGLQLVLLAAVLVAYARRFPPSQSFYAASVDKHRLLELSPSPRLVFVGGSSMALGMDSALVAIPLGFHPVNMALNMGIGLESMLAETEPFLRARDVVVVAPEYHAFQQYFRAHPDYLARLIECRPSLLRSLRWEQIKDLLDRGYAQHLGGVLRFTLFPGPADLMIDGALNPYNSRRSFNENGDVTTHHGVSVARGAALRFALDSPGLAEQAIERLNQFHRDCQRRGVRVFFSHPPYERRYYEKNRASIEQLETRLRNKLNIPMLDTAREMTFSSDEIFDVEYHLNLKGKLRRSKLVAERLSVALQPPSSSPR